MPEGATTACLKRSICSACLALAGLLLTLFPSAAPAQSAGRIIAVGDLHGDYQAWVTIARAAGLIDARDHWIGGRTTLVQLGDITDRGPDSIKIIRNLQQLQREAPRRGGKVVVVLGNHEAMNLLGDYRYTSAGEYAAFTDSQSAARRDRLYELNKPAIETSYRAKDPKLSPEAIRAAWIAATPLGWTEHKLAWMPSGDLGKWAAQNPAIVRIGDTLFVHGGISAEYAKTPIAEINRRVAAAMASGDESPQSILYDPLGPLWYRGLVSRDADAEAARAPTPANATRPPPDQELNAVLAAYGAKRMVIGHTPLLTGIALLDENRLARIDTGISRFYGGPLSWLEINGEQMIPHSVGRPAS